ncbi:MAG: FAD-dependent oxidoreductase [Dehalococcoidia bacterium]|nr:FAD-dependent oxidoreductase [Dehalococcoidia bacterium]
MAKLKYLFQPVRIGSMEVQNRVVMPGMTTGFGVDEDRRVTPQLTEYFVERASSRPGMIIVASTLVHPLVLGEAGPRRISLWDDKVLPGLEEMVKAVHNYDVKFGIQLAQSSGQISLNETVDPSAFSPLQAATDISARDMSKAEIRKTVEAYGSAAQRCIKAGFDFLEVNAAFEYVLSNYLTPFHNRRTDEYGGSFDNRIRFLLEVIRQVKEKVGDETPVGVKINGDDFFREGGWTLPEACRLAPILEKEGVNYLHIAGGLLGSYRWFIPSMYEEQGAFVYLSEEVKKHTSLPVMAVVRIKNPIMADEIIRKGKADLVAMGRAHIADPEIVDKARKGDIADIRPCIGDCRGCIDPFFRNLDAEASCTVNPRMGREYLIKDIEGEKRNTANKVLVAGAGCAGLEAARQAAFAGHRVTLCESKGRIGGQLRMAAMMPKRQEIGDILPWYERQLNKLGVEIRLNTPVDEDLLSQLSPEVLILATGSLPEASLGYINGLENIKDIELLMADELLEEERLTGDSVLVLGGGQIGLQVADYLSEERKRVYVAEKSAQFAGEMAIMDRHYLKERITEKGVRQYENVQKVEILPADEVWIVRAGGREKLPEINTIVLANDRRPNIFLAEVAERKGIETHIIGDASGVDGEDQGTVLAAIAAGYEVGRQI